MMYQISINWINNVRMNNRMYTFIHMYGNSPAACPRPRNNYENICHSIITHHSDSHQSVKGGIIKANTTRKRFKDMFGRVKWEQDRK